MYFWKQSTALVGTWQLSPVAGALAVGPNRGDGSWWSSSVGDVTGRDCIFDDSISFDASGNFVHYMDGNTWIEPWQGVSGEQCGAPVSPHVGGSFTYTYSGNQLTVDGTGAHIGLAKVVNGSELDASSVTVPTSRTYEISFGSNGEMIADINVGSGWWRFIYEKTMNVVPPPPPPSGPTTNAPDPTHLPADVISIFSDTYTDVAGTDFNPGWGQSGHSGANTAYDPGTGNVLLEFILTSIIREFNLDLHKISLVWNIYT